MAVQQETVQSSSSPSSLVSDRAQKLDMLMHVQEFSATIALITGAQGVGKSCLLQAAAQQLSIHHQVISFSATSYSADSQVIDELSEQLGCLPSLAEVESVLGHMQAQDESLFICVDDAQLLEQEALEILLTKSLSSNGWHLTLAGDEHLKQRLDEMQVKLQQENFYHLVALEPLSEEDSNQLIAECYQQAGYTGVPISAKQLHQLFLLSQGNPAKIIEYVELDQQQKQKSANRFPLTHVAALVLVGSALLVSTLYQGDDAYDQEDAIAQLLETEVNATIPKQEDKPVTSADKESLKPADQKAGLLVKAETSSESPQRNPIQTAEPNKASAVQTQQALLASQSAERDINQRQLEQQQRVKALAKKTVVKARQHPLLNAQDKSYVLQLLGVRSKNSAEEFVKRFSRQLDASELNIYETKYKGSPWFVVVYGPFDTKQLAAKQAGSLAKSMKGTPWVRPISQIQKDIRQVQSQ